MPNAIQFLETLGRSPSGADILAGGYAASVAALDIDEAQRAALLGRDARVLNGLLDGRDSMLCVVATPDDESESESETPPDDGREPPDDGPDAARE